MKDVVYADECYKIIGACFEVYKEKGSGFLEAVFQECLAIELDMQSIPFAMQSPLALSYKRRLLNQRYVAD
ncbi:MAG TPA: GxxExxY protein, partial [Candidatus Didemnitutus sp.]|nr:GxxExxY protein [Candidatus Didemnitutus sp.]